MTLDETNPPTTIAEAYQHGFADGQGGVLSELDRFAQEEARLGDGRAMRLLQRFRERLGKRKRPIHEDNGN